MKSFMDDPKSWGAWNDPGAKKEVVASAPEPSLPPKPLTLADIRVGEKYVTLAHDVNGHIGMSQWKCAGVPRTHESEYASMQGLLVLDVLVTDPLDTEFAFEIFAISHGLEFSSKQPDNGHRTFPATDEYIALIQGIVERQDYAAYAELAGVHVHAEREYGKISAFDVVQPMENVRFNVSGEQDSNGSDKLNVLSPIPTEQISLLERRGRGVSQQSNMSLELTDEFLERLAELLKAKG